MRRVNRWRWLTIRYSGLVVIAQVQALFIVPMAAIRRSSAIAGSSMKYRKWIRLMTPLPTPTGFRAHVLCADIPVGGKTLCLRRIRPGPERRGTSRDHGKDRDRSNCHVFAFNKHLVGDFENGIIWELSRDVFDDGGLPIVWERTFHASSPDFKRLFFRELVITWSAVSVWLMARCRKSIRLVDDGGQWSSKREASMEPSATTCRWSVA